jgi:hypothetical protein
MTCTEDQFRAILRAEAADITPDSVPPLMLPQPARRTARGQSRLRGPRLTWRLVAPLGAAAAVIAVITAAVTIAGGDHPRPAAPAGTPASRQVPPYYMYLPYPSCETDGHHCTPAELAAYVRRTTTGAIVGKVLPPRSTYFVDLVGASDDRTFVLMTARVHSTACSPSAACLPPITFYLARFDPADGAIALHALPIPAVPARDAEAFALSPNGTELAVATLPGGTSRTLVTQIRVYSLISNAVREWQGAGSVDAMVWGPDGQLGIDWAGATRAGIEMLNANTAGGSLLGASRLAVNYDQPGHYTLRQGFAISADGKTIVDQVLRTPSGNRNPDGQIRWYSVATGRETRSYTPSPANTGNEQWQVLWSNSSGSVTVLRRTTSDKTDRSDTFGILTGGKFVPIPVPLLAGQVSDFFGNPLAF